MKINKMLQRLRRRAAVKPQSLDVTANWSSRDWADLPIHHPRSN